MKRRKIFMFLIGFVSACVSTTVVLAIAFFVFLAWIVAYGCPMPQDCEAWGFVLSGTVVNRNGIAVEEATIHVQQNHVCGEYYEITLTTDQEGNFRSEHISTFRCVAFDVVISADGYKTQKYTYYPPSSLELSDEYPDNAVFILEPK